MPDKSNIIINFFAAIDLNDQFAQRELRGIASDPDDQNLISLNNFTMLPTLLQGLLASVCNSKYAHVVKALV